MRKKNCLLLGILLCIALIVTPSNNTTDPIKSQKISTNKEKLLSIAVRGQIAPAQPSTSYAVTWNGKPKMAIGIGGINYNLKVGEKVFGWANGDRSGRFEGTW